MLDKRTLLLLTVAILILLGILMSLSASLVLPTASGVERSYARFKWHLSYITIGVVLGMIAARINPNFWRIALKPLLGITLLLLIYVLIAPPIGGVHRWIKLGPLHFQPSRLASFTLVLYIANYIERKKSTLCEFKRGTLPLLFVVGIILVLILREPSYGLLTVMSVTVLLLFILGGVPLKHIGCGMAVAIPLAVFQFLRTPYAVDRLKQYLKSPPAQIMNAVAGISSGGIWGKGIGGGEIKLSRIPAAHTDCVFAVIGEEMGLLGTVLVLTMFTVFYMLVLRIASEQAELFNQLLITGLGTLIYLEAMLHVAINLGFIPTTGLMLPFVSMGGSANVLFLIGVGIIWRLSQPES